MDSSQREIGVGAHELKLDRLEAAASLKDFPALPGNRFEALSGDRKGQYSIRINDQWRICFEWPAESAGPVTVEIVDYLRSLYELRLAEQRKASEG